MVSPCSERRGERKNFNHLPKSLWDRDGKSLSALIMTDKTKIRPGKFSSPCCFSDSSSMMCKMCLGSGCRRLNWMLWAWFSSVCLHSRWQHDCLTKVPGTSWVALGILTWPPAPQRWAPGLQPAPCRLFKYACVWPVTHGLCPGRFTKPLVDISSDNYHTCSRIRRFRCLNLQSVSTLSRRVSEPWEH